MTQPISVRLDDQNKENVDRLAKMTKRSRSFIINEAVADAQSGYGHSSEYTHTWMKSWRREYERPAPTLDITPQS